MLKCPNDEKHLRFCAKGKQTIPVTLYALPDGAIHHFDPERGGIGFGHHVERDEKWKCAECGAIAEEPKKNGWCDTCRHLHCSLDPEDRSGPSCKRGHKWDSNIHVGKPDCSSWEEQPSHGD